MLFDNIRVNNIICSDINSDLINLWNTIKDNPEELIIHYEYNHNEFKKDNSHYYVVRERFNKNKDCKDFMFLLRTAWNGLVRFNSKGQFNSPIQYERKGINPEEFKVICYDWSNILNKYDVQFICKSYDDNINYTKNDFIYLDPPYANTVGLYYGCIDYENFFSWLRKLPCKYVLSFDGKTNNKGDSTYSIPKDLYSKHIYIENGNSSFRRLTGNSRDTIVYESLYIK